MDLRNCQISQILPIAGVTRQVENPRWWLEGHRQHQASEDPDTARIALPLSVVLVLVGLTQRVRIARDPVYGSVRSDSEWNEYDAVDGSGNAVNSMTIASTSALWRRTFVCSHYVMCAPCIGPG